MPPSWFGCNLVCGFTGSDCGRARAGFAAGIQTSVYGPLVKQAEERNVRIAFENCDMRGNWEQGDWNIAHAPGRLGDDLRRAIAERRPGAGMGAVPPDGRA